VGKESRRKGHRSRVEREKRPEWAALEENARLRIQEWLQDLLRQEITDLLGREKSERRPPGKPGRGGKAVLEPTDRKCARQGVP